MRGSYAVTVAETVILVN